MRSRPTALIALSVAAALLALSACGPPSISVFGGNWVDAIKKAVEQVFDHPPDNTNVDCAVTLFDQSVRPEDYRAQYTPVHRPNDIYAWLTACLGSTHGQHTVRTHKASGYQNSPNPAKQAVCWALSPNPDGDLIFDCYFDRNPANSWVVYLALSRDGYLAVGV